MRAFADNDIDGEMLSRLGAEDLSFFRDAIGAMVVGGMWDDALRYAAALENYTRAEPLPWSELFVARARALLDGRKPRRIRAARIAHASFDARLRGTGRLSGRRAGCASKGIVVCLGAFAAL